MVGIDDWLGYPTKYSSKNSKKFDIQSTFFEFLELDLVGSSNSYKIQKIDEFLFNTGLYLIKLFY
jgi:hypothetical protein